MWMRILVAAGFPFIGERFPAAWGDLFDEANPDGFYESQLVGGIYFRTNPSPVTGAFLFPEQTRTHAVKVFVPGLVRTDLAFIDRVIGTVRDWREYVASVERLRGMTGLDRPPEALPPWLEWWNDNYNLIRDLAVRRYAAHVVSYQALLDDPGREIAAVVDWLGTGDAAQAIRIVDPQKRTQRDPSEPDGVDPEDAAVFDDLYHHVHRGLELSNAFIERLNATDRRLRPLIEAREAAYRRRAAQALVDGSLSDPPSTP